MSRTDRHSRPGPAGRARAPSSAPRISPVFPLLLLETMRDQDRPEEVLEDEDVSVSLPRRLGLSDVVGVQIRRFQAEVRQRRPQTAEQVEDLIRLVLRRPDAEAIFAEAGRRVAVHFWMQRPPLMRRTVRLLPRWLALKAAQRAGRRMFRQLTSGKLELNRWPVELRIHHSVSSHGDPSGSACAFYASALGELLHRYTGRRYRVLHPRCQTRGGETCEWTLELAG
jgi:bacteriochlorophyll 4-vinyl reductase